MKTRWPVALGAAYRGIGIAGLLPRRGLALALWLGLVLGAGAGPDEKPAPEFVIGLSPFLENAVKDKVYRQVIGFVVDDLPLGASLRIYDAYDLQTVTELVVPQNPAFRSAKTRANQFKGQIYKLKQFLAAQHHPPVHAGLKFDDAVRLPQFLDFLRGALPQASGPVQLILLGNPLYVDPKEPQFSMSDGYFPSDGHLRVDRDQSVYGIADRANWLASFAIHQAWFQDPWVSDLHREKISRFWQLFLRGQGARLVTFTGDLATAFKNARLSSEQQPPALVGAAPDPSQTKVEMLRITRDVATADWLTREGVAAAQEAPSTSTGPMKIGIRWKGNWDLDLYASAKPGAETLFFQHTRCEEGYYYKDHRSSPGREYEFIEFTTPVDVHEVDAMVNFYKGAAHGGPVGEVRVEFEGRIYSGTFRIAAAEGNQGRSDASHTEYWTRLDIPKLLHLATQP